MDYFKFLQQVNNQSNLLSLKTKIKSLAHRRVLVRKEMHRLGKINSKLSLTDIENKKDLMLKNDLIKGNIRYDGSWETRHHHLAYGLLRGIPYFDMERTCKIVPNPEQILDIIHKYCSYSEKQEWTLDKVKKLLSPPTTFEKIKEFIKSI